MLQAEARLALNEINVSAKLPVAALLFVCVICTFSPRSRIGVHTGDNVGVDAGEQLAAEILDAIRADRESVSTPAIMLGWTLENSWLRKSSTPSGRIATSMCLISISWVPTAWNAHARCWSKSVTPARIPVKRLS